MLANFTVFFLGTACAFILFWAIPSRLPKLRQDTLTAVSASMVLFYSPGGFLAALALFCVPLLAQAGFAYKRNVWIFWIFLIASLTPLVGLRLLTDQSFFISFGVAFATVRSMGLVLVAYGGRMRLASRDVALMIYFFPLFTVGPVERLVTFSADNFATKFDLNKIIYGSYRIAIGLFLVMFVCTELLEPLRNDYFGRDSTDIDTFTRAQALGFVIVSFLYTYINFEGFSAIAIGVSRLFGLKVAENFDRPLMVTNIADFWKRYHISMGNWINQFIFFPLVIWIKKPWASYAATIIAFVLFGMWHAFNLNYLIWGLGNGLGVAMIHYGLAHKVFPLIKTKGLLKTAIGCVTGSMAIIYVAWLQTFANLADFETALLLTQRLTLGF
jgi:alginate O-acetyltransferase complex protein AlgI